MQIDNRMITTLQNHLEYTEEEARYFLSDPVRAQLALNASGLMDKLIVAEIVASHGCGSQHRVGDRIYFDGFGNLLIDMNKKNVCIFAMSALTPIVNAAIELFYADVDPNEMRLKRVGCQDVGLKCGGVGHVVFAFSMIDPD